MEANHSSDSLKGPLSDGNASEQRFDYEKIHNSSSVEKNLIQNRRRDQEHSEDGSGRSSTIDMSDKINKLFKINQAK